MSIRSNDAPLISEGVPRYLSNNLFNAPVDGALPDDVLEFWKNLDEVSLFFGFRRTAHDGRKQMKNNVIQSISCS